MRVREKFDFFFGKSKSQNSIEKKTNIDQKKNKENKKNDSLAKYVKIPTAKVEQPYPKMVPLNHF